MDDLRKKSMMEKRRQIGADGIMIWSGIGYKVKTDLRFLEEKLNKQKYINLLSEQIDNHGQFEWRMGRLNN